MVDVVDEITGLYMGAADNGIVQGLDISRHNKCAK